MTFASSFGRVFSPTFQPKSTPAASAGIPCLYTKGAAGYGGNLGSDVTIDDLHAGDFTCEFWFKAYAAIAYNAVEKGVTQLYVGWRVALFTNNVNFLVRYSITNASISYSRTQDYLPHHYALTFSGAGDLKARLFIDGTLKATSVAAAGSPKSDASNTLGVGYYPEGGDRQINAAFGWFRLSNNIRYTSDFTPAGMTEYPTNDANTVRLFKMNEGSGTVLTDYSSNAKNGTNLKADGWILV